MITLTEEERAFTSSLVNDLYQNYNYRSVEPAGLLESILSKLVSTGVSFTEQESRRIQYLLQDRSEIYSRIADPRLQHILNTQNNQGFGASGSSCRGGFFNGPRMYQLCQSVLKKLETGL